MMRAYFQFSSALISCICCISVNAQDLQLNGIASYNEYNKEVYLAALQVSETSSNRQQLIESKLIQKMELRFTTEYSSQHLTKLLIQNLAINNSPASLKTHANDITSLNRILQEPLLAGDQLSILKSPLDKTVIKLNGVVLKEFKHSFFPILLKIWLGNLPPSQEFRDNLLTPDSLSPSLLSRFEQIKPSEKRILAIQKNKESVEPDINNSEYDKSLSGAEVIISKQLYSAKLLRHTYEYIRYPKRALKRNQQGSVRFNVTIDREGQVKKMEAVLQSKYPLLNRAAIKAINKSSPFPEIPETIQAEEFTFLLPIAFKIRKQ